MRGCRVLPQHGGRLLAEQRVARALVATQAVRRIPRRDRSGRLGLLVRLGWVGVCMVCVCITPAGGAYR